MSQPSRHRRETLLPILLLLALAACGPPAGAPAAPASSSAAPADGRAELRTVLLQQIAAYQREIDTAAQQRRCPGPNPAFPIDPYCLMAILDGARERSPEFAAYVRWVADVYPCRHARGPCAPVGGPPLPAMLRDPQLLDLYLAEQGRR